VSRELQLYLQDILDATDKIERYTAQRELDDLLSDSMLADAVVFNLLVIGEAAGKIPQDIRNAYPAIPWQQIVGLRNVIAHEYFGLDLDIIWDVVVSELPILRHTVKTILTDL
jgi:uncharacterized protein with HEPN domain